MCLQYNLNNISSEFTLKQGFFSKKVNIYIYIFIYLKYRAYEIKDGFECCIFLYKNKIVVRK